MDGGSFDRLTRLFAGRVTRRVGLAGALAGMVAGGAGSAPELEARRRRGGSEEVGGEVIDEKRPCGPKAKDNRCRKHKDCCTKYCKRPKGKQRIGRCRCVKPGRKCKNGQKCCGGAICQNKRCTALAACGAAGGACASDANCCTGLLCQAGSCTAEPPCVPIVCAGCAYTTIQAAIDDKEGQADHLIEIAAGTYTEDLSISGDVTLRGCGSVTVKNATPGRRTIQLPTTSPSPAPFPIVEIRSITVTTDTVAPNFGGGIGGSVDGLGDDGDGGYADVTLSGATRVTRNRIHNKGGGIRLGVGTTLTMKDDSEVSENFSDTYGGGGIRIDTYGKLFLRDRSTVRNNTTNGDGGGIYVFYGGIELSGSASVTGNSSGKDGGGLTIYADTYTVENEIGMPLLTMKDQSSVSNNTSSTGRTSDATNKFTGGGGIDVTGGCDDTNFSSPFPGNQTCSRIVMSGSASITGNSAGRSGAGGFGGGINADYVDLVLSDSASIAGNSAYASDGGATGSQVMLNYSPDRSRLLTVTETGSATIADQCRIYNSSTPSMTTCSA